MRSLSTEEDFYRIGMRRKAEPGMGDDAHFRLLIHFAFSSII